MPYGKRITLTFIDFYIEVNSYYTDITEDFCYFDYLEVIFFLDGVQSMISSNNATIPFQNFVV